MELNPNLNAVKIRFMRSVRKIKKIKLPQGRPKHEAYLKKFQELMLPIVVLDNTSPELDSWINNQSKMSSHDKASPCSTPPHLQEFSSSERVTDDMCRQGYEISGHSLDDSDSYELETTGQKRPHSLQPYDASRSTDMQVSGGLKKKFHSMKTLPANKKPKMPSFSTFKKSNIVQQRGYMSDDGVTGKTGEPKHACHTKTTQGNSEKSSDCFEFCEDENIIKRDEMEVEGQVHSDTSEFPLHHLSMHKDNHMLPESPASPTLGRPSGASVTLENQGHSDNTMTYNSRKIWTNSNNKTSVFDYSEMDYDSFSSINPSCEKRIANYSSAHRKANNDNCIKELGTCTNGNTREKERHDGFDGIKENVQERVNDTGILGQHVELLGDLQGKKDKSVYPVNSDISVSAHAEMSSSDDETTQLVSDIIEEVIANVVNINEKRDPKTECTDLNDTQLQTSSDNQLRDSQDFFKRYTEMNNLSELLSVEPSDPKTLKKYSDSAISPTTEAVSTSAKSDIILKIVRDKVIPTGVNKRPLSDCGSTRNLLDENSNTKVQRMTTAKVTFKKHKKNRRRKFKLTMPAKRKSVPSPKVQSVLLATEEPELTCVVTVEDGFVNSDTQLKVQKKTATGKKKRLRDHVKPKRKTSIKAGDESHGARKRKYPRRLSVVYTSDIPSAPKENAQDTQSQPLQENVTKDSNSTNPDLCHLEFPGDSKKKSDSKLQNGSKESHPSQSSAYNHKDGRPVDGNGESVYCMDERKTYKHDVTYPTARQMSTVSPTPCAAIASDKRLDQQVQHHNSAENFKLHKNESKHFPWMISADASPKQPDMKSRDQFFQPSRPKDSSPALSEPPKLWRPAFLAEPNLPATEKTEPAKRVRSRYESTVPLDLRVSAKSSSSIKRADTVPLTSMAKPYDSYFSDDSSLNMLSSDSKSHRLSNKLELPVAFGAVDHRSALDSYGLDLRKSSPHKKPTNTQLSNDLRKLTTVKKSWYDESTRKVTDRKTSSTNSRSQSHGQLKERTSLGAGETIPNYHGNGNAESHTMSYSRRKPGTPIKSSSIAYFERNVSSKKDLQPRQHSRSDALKDTNVRHKSAVYSEGKIPRPDHVKQNNTMASHTRESHRYRNNDNSFTSKLQESTRRISASNEIVPANKRSSTEHMLSDSKTSRSREDHEKIRANQDSLLYPPLPPFPNLQHLFVPPQHMIVYSQPVFPPVPREDVLNEHTFRDKASDRSSDVKHIPQQNSEHSRPQSTIPPLSEQLLGFPEMHNNWLMQQHNLLKQYPLFDPLQFLGYPPSPSWFPHLERSDLSRASESRNHHPKEPTSVRQTREHDADALKDKGHTKKANNTSGSCEACGKHAAFLCSGCKVAGYCSAECQMTSWKSHVFRCIASSK